MGFWQNIQERLLRGPSWPSDQELLNVTKCGLGHLWRLAYVLK